MPRPKKPRRKPKPSAARASWPLPPIDDTPDLLDPAYLPDAAMWTVELQATFPTELIALADELYNACGTNCRVAIEADSGPGPCERCRARWLTSELLRSLADDVTYLPCPPSHFDPATAKPREDDPHA